VWWFPVVLALHVLEEAPGFTAWARQHASDRYTQDRTYSPGLVTAITQFIPLWARLTRLARREGLLTRRGAKGAALLGGLIHAVAVSQRVSFVELPERSSER
jgi:hypothetical protein